MSTIYIAPWTIEYDYQAPEAATLEYPGCDEDVWINSVMVDGWEVLDSFRQGYVDDLNRRVLEKIREDRQQAWEEYLALSQELWDD